MSIICDFFNSEKDTIRFTFNNQKILLLVFRPIKTIICDAKVINL